MLGWRSVHTQSDKTDVVWEFVSEDHGESWREGRSQQVVEQRPEGIWRRNYLVGWGDPETGWLLLMGNEGIFKGDHPVEDGMRNWFPVYRVSKDGGRTWAVESPVIQEGPPGRYTSSRPLEGVEVGRNAAFLGDMGCRPIRSREGLILVPLQICPVGPDGQYWNPGGGYTFHECAVLLGKWTPEGRIVWNLSERVALDPSRSTRGCLEPTLAEMPDGRILMVMRGSNEGRFDPDCRKPGYRWRSVSNDGGRTWSAVEPWTYEDGEPFFSPSSMSLLLPHSSGSIFWLGNITPENPRGNSPRYPLVIGKVDPKSLTLCRRTVQIVADREPGDPENLILSNFHAYEDRRTGEIVVQVSRFIPNPWHGNAWEYRVRVDQD